MTTPLLFLPMDRIQQVGLLGQRDGYAAAIALSTAGLQPPVTVAVRAAWSAAQALVQDWQAGDQEAYSEGFYHAWEKAVAWLQPQAEAGGLQSTLELTTVIAAQRDSVLAVFTRRPALTKEETRQIAAQSGWDAFLAHINVPIEDRANLRRMYTDIFCTEFDRFWDSGSGVLRDAN